MTHLTLKAAMKTNHEPVIVKEKTTTIDGKTRTMIHAKKANGKKFYFIVKYENGTYSTAFTI